MPGHSGDTAGFRSTSVRACWLIIVVIIGVLGAAFTVWWSLDQTGSEGSEGFRIQARTETPTELPGADFVPPASFVTQDSCGDCHPAEVAAWQSSHHARAMGEASGALFVGKVPAQVAAQAGEPAAQVFEREGRTTVRTEGADGSPANFELRYTFGYFPLQQLLVETDRGRLQPLRLSWDSRPEGDGGQRWFHLYTGKRIAPGDILHWLGPNQNVQGVCGDCHSTGYRRGYDAASDSFSTTQTELAVSCEACHGPASGHLAWAKQREKRPSAHRGFERTLTGASATPWLPGLGSTAPRPAQPRKIDDISEVEACSPCHSRRRLLAEDPRPPRDLLDLASPALALPPLYYGDGQIRDEVYVWGSFLQSKMHAAGVTCSNCHDPHTGRLRAEGDLVCGQCHQLSDYGSAEHHRHPAQAQTTCVSCHMLEVTYMEVDPRHDHGFRVPRPDLTSEFGIPSTCQGCHRDEPEGWAAQEVKRLWPELDGSTPARWLALASTGDPAALSHLLPVARDAQAPEMTRAAALVAASRLPGSTSHIATALEHLQRDARSLVRLAALESSAALPASRRLRLLAGWLDDSSFAVRAEAMRALVTELPREAWLPLRKHVQPVVDEYRAAQQPFLDRAATRTILASIALGLGERSQTRDQLEAALRLDPNSVPAVVNLADLERLEGRESAGLQLLESFLVRVPDAAPAWHARGLALVRAQRLGEAVEALTRAARLDPSSSQYAFVAAAALDASGSTQAALGMVEQGLKDSPFAPALHQARVGYSSKLGDHAAARAASHTWLERLAHDADARRAVEVWGR